MGKGHVAKLERSERLKRLLSVFESNPNRPLSTLQLINMAGICAVNSACHELRMNGIPVSPARVINGNHCYTLVKMDGEI